MHLQNLITKLRKEGKALQRVAASTSAAAAETEAEAASPAVPPAKRAAPPATTEEEEEVPTTPTPPKKITRHATHSNLLHQQISNLPHPLLRLWRIQLTTSHSLRSPHRYRNT
mmetsp:Transcript_7243/g.11398  ORF Transcript_7243/g.11398 Transcript_7243/m.11398 type:complete len:113 (-) Transcript_7243:518-856(-)